jgi:hypothetical protein
MSGGFESGGVLVLVVVVAMAALAWVTRDPRRDHDWRGHDHLHERSFSERFRHQWQEQMHDVKMGTPTDGRGGSWSSGQFLLGVTLAFVVLILVLLELLGHHTFLCPHIGGLLHG